jgi:hypothetical protein
MEKYIAGEELDFFWSEMEMQRVRRAWKEGWSVWSIGQIIDRDPDEVAILLIDLIKKDELEYREGGIWGWKPQISHLVVV